MKKLCFSTVKFDSASHLKLVDHSTIIFGFTVSTILAIKLLLGFGKLEWSKLLLSDQRQIIKETVVDFLFLYKDYYPCSSGNPAICSLDFCVGGPDADPDIFDKVTCLLARLSFRRWWSSCLNRRCSRAVSSKRNTRTLRLAKRWRYQVLNISMKKLEFLKQSMIN